jgi:hypothetical protein
MLYTLGRFDLAEASEAAESLLNETADEAERIYNHIIQQRRYIRKTGTPVQRADDRLTTTMLQIRENLAQNRPRQWPLRVVLLRVFLHVNGESFHPEWALGRLGDYFLYRQAKANRR